MNQHIVPGADLSLGYQAMPCSMTHYRDSCGFSEAHCVGDSIGIDGGSGDVFGMPAVPVYAQPLLINAVLVHTLDAVLTGAALNPVVQQHPVSLLQAKIGSWADLHYFSGNVAAHGTGQQAAIALGQVQVQVIEGTGPNPQHYFPRLNFWLRAVSIGQRRRAA